MVRDMMEGEETTAAPDDERGERGVEGFGVPHGQRGKVVSRDVGGQGRKTTTYVGATHFMAMLDDVSLSNLFLVRISLMIAELRTPLFLFLSLCVRLDRRFEELL